MFAYVCVLYVFTWQWLECGYSHCIFLPSECGHIRILMPSLQFHVPQPVIQALKLLMSFKQHYNVSITRFTSAKITYAE